MQSYSGSARRANFLALMKVIELELCSDAAEA
jgi:hypothetical protein